jgi:hypothetical protein
VAQPAGVAVENFDGGDVIALAGGLCTGGLRLRHGGRALLQIGRGGRCPNGMIEAHGDAPVRHGASGIGAEDLREGPLGFVVPEGMQHRDAPVENRLHGRAARDRKMYPAEVVAMGLVGQRQAGGKQEDQQVSHLRSSLS